MAGIDSNTILMLHLNNSLTDVSSSAYAMTNSGITYSNSSPEFTGTYYGVFNGSSYGRTTNNFAQFGNTFTVDFWSYLSTTSQYSAYFDKYATSGNTGYVIFEWNYTGSKQGIIFTATMNSNSAYAQYYVNWTPSINVWHHIACVRNGTNFYIFIDGVSQTLTVPGAIGSQNIDTLSIPLQVGYDQDDGRWLNGGMCEFRISNVARWTSNFTPPTSPYTGSFISELGLLGVG